MDDAISELIGIGGFLFMGWMCYAFAKTLSKGADRAKAYTLAIAVAIALGAFAHYSLGTHREYDDPMFGGGGVEIHDDAPSPEQRSHAGWRTFLLTAVAFSLGVYRSNQSSS